MKNLRDLTNHKFSMPLVHIIRIGALFILFLTITFLEIEPSNYDDSKAINIETSNKCNAEFYLSKTDLAIYKLFDVDLNAKCQSQS